MNDGEILSCGGSIERGAIEVGQVVEIVGLDRALGQDEELPDHGSLGEAPAAFIPSNGIRAGADELAELILRKILRIAPVGQFHSVRPSIAPRPKWLAQIGPFWQYATMAYSQIAYARRVANENTAPNRIKELREAMDLSQSELARRVHADASTINKLEMGKRGLDQNWMRRLAAAFDVSPAELLPDEDHAWRLSDEEKSLLIRLRTASVRDRETVRKVTDAILPDDNDSEGKAA